LMLYTLTQLIFFPFPIYKALTVNEISLINTCIT
jgi:hypothetical protein